MEVEYQIALSGAPTATTLSLNLPAGHSIDTTKLLNTTSGEQPLGRGSALDTASSYYPNLLCRYSSATSVDVQVDFQGAAGNAVYTAATPVTQAIPFAFGSGDKLWASISVPILGWSSSVVVSSSTDTRVVAFAATGTVPTTTANNPLVYPTVTFDTHGAYNATTGRYTVPVPGFYKIKATLAANHAQYSGFQVYKNGVAQSPASGSADLNGYIDSTFLMSFVAGDIVDVRCSATNGSSATAKTLFSIERLSGPSQVASSETVAASYWVSANQAITANVTTINYDTREFDSHGMVTTGAGWVATIPISGTYLFTGSMAASAACNCVLYKNGVAYKFIGSQPSGASGSNSATVRLVAGDQISFRGNTSVTVTGAASLASNPAHIGILRVGN
jgi:hypothetical protein